MAEYLPVRAINRSQNVRIGKQRVTSTATTYIDLSDATARREFQHHSALGAVFVVGAITDSAESVVVQSGVNTDEGSSAADMKVMTYAGLLKNRATGDTVPVAQTESTLAAADGTNPRIDIIQVKTADGTVSKVTGTAAASPVAKSPEAGNILVAEISVPKEDTAIGNAQITDKRQFA